MSFSDLMSSGRGPGVIGMIMALIVLLGFGLLFMFAFDEGFQGGGQTIEGLIAEQAREIEGMEDRASAGKESLALVPGRNAAADELSRVKRENLNSQDSIVKLNSRIDAVNQDLVQQRENFEIYKNDYRAQARAAAKGTEMETLETTSGVVYKRVNIREVTAIGIQIRHEEGQKRIAFEELPEAMKDHFQFDPNQKEEALANESSVRDQHDAAVAAASVVADAQMVRQRDMEKERVREKLNQEIAVKESQITMLKGEILSLERDITRAEADAAAARAAGRMHINKSGSISGNIRSKQSRISTLGMEINQLRSRL